MTVTTLFWFNNDTVVGIFECEYCGWDHDEEVEQCTSCGKSSFHYKQTNKNKKIVGQVAVMQVFKMYLDIPPGRTGQVGAEWLLKKTGELLLLAPLTERHRTVLEAMHSVARAALEHNEEVLFWG